MSWPARILPRTPSLPGQRSCLTPHTFSAARVPTSYSERCASTPNGTATPEGRSPARWFEQPAQRVGVMPSWLKHAWTVLWRRVGSLRAMEPKYARLELDGSHNRLAPLEALRHLRKTLADKVRATLRAED